MLEKSQPEEPMILRGAHTQKQTVRVIFLSPREAECPTQCSATVTREAVYNKAIIRIEQRLQA